MSLRVVEIQQNILRKNSTLAHELRGRFAREGTYVLNMLSSPGSGKTTLIEHTLHEMRAKYRVAALVGDQATDNDASRLQRSGVPVKQISTGAECRLDAAMIGTALSDFAPEGVDLLIIENVGNLICPAEYDLGEDLRAVVFSVTEGEDKPLKYPLAFATAHVAILSKIDLIAATEFDRDEAVANIRRVNPSIALLELSARSGEGVEEWLYWLAARVDEKKAIRAPGNAVIAETEPVGTPESDESLAR